MDKSEAGELLRNHLNPWRTRSYRELADRIGETERLEVSGASETQYQVTTQVFWDSKPHGDLRVVGSIDDGGWRAFLPLSDSFIMAPDGSFVAERAARELMQLVDEARSRFGDKLDWPERGRGLWRRARGACASDAD